MIEIMLLELYKNSLNNAKERKSAMEHILYEMEEAGMLPPENPNNFHDVAGDTVYIREWEPEDEQK